MHDGPLLLDGEKGRPFVQRPGGGMEGAVGLRLLCFRSLNLKP